MRTAPSECRRWAVLAATMLVAGCGKRSDSIAQGERQDVLNGVAVPALPRRRRLLEEGFVYGLPIVMNYAVMYAVCRRQATRGSSRRRSTISTIRRACSPTRTRPLSRRTLIRAIPCRCLDLRAEPMASRSRPWTKSLLLGDALRRQHIQLWLYRQPSDRHRCRRHLVVGPDWKSEPPAGIKQVFRSTTQFSQRLFRTELFNAEDMPNVVKVQAGYKVRPLSAYLKQASPAAVPAVSFPRDRQRTRSRRTSSSIWTSSLQFPASRPRRDRLIRDKLAQHWHRAGRKFEFKDLSLEHKAAMSAPA